MTTNSPIVPSTPDALRAALDHAGVIYPRDWDDDQLRKAIADDPSMLDGDIAPLKVESANAGLVQAVAEAYYQSGATAAAEALNAYFTEAAKRYAQSGADALYRHLQDTGALATSDRVVVKEVVRNKAGVIVAFVERSVTEADVEAYRR